MSTSRMSTKGQVVIPQDVRRRLGLRPGDRIDFTVHGEHAHLSKQGDALGDFLAGPKTTWSEGELERLLDEQYR